MPHDIEKPIILNNTKTPGQDIASKQVLDVANNLTFGTTFKAGMMKEGITVVQPSRMREESPEAFKNNLMISLNDITLIEQRPKAPVSLGTSSATLFGKASAITQPAQEANKISPADQEPQKRQDSETPGLNK